ncbi:MAG: beta-propeller domain-containing protein [Candidatus Diapherotrites archaeon]|nr:beta-propeller domain-containing protein [Candidatus Diapherotrites archaeon]
MSRKKNVIDQVAGLGLLLVAVVIMVSAVVMIDMPDVTVISAGILAPPVVLPTGEYTAAAFNPLEELAARSFASDEEFAAFARDYEDAYYGYRGFEMTDAVIGAPMPGMAMAEGGAGEKQAIDFSETNVQVAGIDEGDLIKTDGDYIYTVSGDTVYIIKAYPGEDAEIVSKIEYDYEPSELFIHGDRLAVFGNYYGDVAGIDFVPQNGMSFFDVYDVSDRSSPKPVKEYLFEGRFFRARMYGDYAYFVATNGFDYRPIYPTPLIIEDGEVRAMPAPDIHYFPIPYHYPDLLTVHAIDLANLGEESSKAIAVEGGQSLYMSAENMYITYTEYVNEYDLRNDITKSLLEDELTRTDRGLIELIVGLPAEILTHHEKEAKILGIYTNHLNYMTQKERDELEDEIEVQLKKKLKEYEYFEFTVISQLGIKGGEITIGSTGKVPGHVVNQFSMDEHGGVFRIATTVSPRWSWRWKDRSESVNNVFALDSSLKVIGELGEVAEGEQIYSTRFMGDKLYMVTFRQVDPFFVIDLSDPTDIKSLGELKIPGFSRYLHPYDETTIIGIGQETTETGRVMGLKVSLFDVTDVSDPQEVAKFVTEERYAQSTALTEHHAFLFSKEKELMVIPVYSGWGADGDYDGAFVFRISKDAIELRGLVDHSSGGRYGPSVQRSLYIEELLYTKSPSLLRINEIEDLSPVKDIKLGATDFPVF